VFTAIYVSFSLQENTELKLKYLGWGSGGVRKNNKFTNATLGTRP
jgi:hypothetical protein